MSKTNLAVSIETTDELETLLSIKKKQEVKQILQSEHGMIMEVGDNKKEGETMCNFGEVLYEEGIEKGIESGLINLITKKLEKGKDISTIADEVEETEERVLELVEKYQLSV